MITIEGVTALHGAEHEVIPDRIEAGTYLVAGAITGGHVVVERCRPEHMEPLLMKLRESGVELIEEKERVHLKVTRRLKGTECPHHARIPGFPPTCRRSLSRSWQWPRGPVSSRKPSLKAGSCMWRSCDAWARIFVVEGNRVVITGRGTADWRPCYGVGSSRQRRTHRGRTCGRRYDRRSLRVYHLDRGYERLEEKFWALGASVERRKGK